MIFISEPHFLDVSTGNMGKLEFCYFKKCDKVSCKRVHEVSSQQEGRCIKYLLGNCRNGNCRFDHLDHEEIYHVHLVELSNGSGFKWDRLHYLKANKALDGIGKLNRDKLCDFVTAFMFLMEHHADELIRNSDEYLDNLKEVLDRDLVDCTLCNGFQTTIIPLLGMLCCSQFETSSLLSEKNKIYKLLEGLLDRFQHSYYDALKKIANEGLNSYWEHKSIVVCNKPMVYSEFFYPIFKILAKNEEHGLNARTIDAEKWRQVNLKYVALFRGAEQMNLFLPQEKSILNQLSILVNRQEKALNPFKKSTKVEKVVKSVKQDPPGGRNDNDFVDFKQINILPTLGPIHLT